GAVLLHTDRTMLAQVLLNLSLNALQACPRGAGVTLAARRRGGAALVIVEDRGRGLPEDHRERLFSPFFTTRPDGTGLGLTGCRRIARQLGGDVRLYPRRRGGTRAVLSLDTVAASSPTTTTADEGRRCPATTC
ncbi:MAG: ATP-binding protein, partial [Planctomycetes bacterium]|nr:ATP-binding protein [Planctomycetota bacterium]